MLLGSPTPPRQRLCVRHPGWAVVVAFEQACLSIGPCLLLNVHIFIYYPYCIAEMQAGAQTQLPRLCGSFEASAVKLLSSAYQAYLLHAAGNSGSSMCFQGSLRPAAPAALRGAVQLSVGQSEILQRRAGESSALSTCPSVYALRDAACCPQI